MNNTPAAQLPALTLSAPQKISELDKNYKRLVKNKTLVQLKGKIIQQSKTPPHWAFIEDDTGIVLLDFAATSPNLSLPPKQINKTLIIEGFISPSETIINEYLIIPTTYKLEV